MKNMNAPYKLMSGKKLFLANDSIGACFVYEEIMTPDCLRPKII